MAAAIIIAAVYAGCAYWCIRNLDIPYLWYDESGQFYIAKGLNHWSEFGAPDGSVADVIHNNARYNLDPGGYSLLLRLWIEIGGTSHLWLRALPLLLFALAIAAIIHLIFRLTHDRLWAAIAGLTPYLITWAIYSFELRPYPMELAGIILGATAVFSIREKPYSYRRLLLWSLTLSVFLTARYAGLMAIFVDCCFIIYFIMSAKELTVSDRIARCAAFGTLPLLTVAGIYMMELRIQNPSFIPLNYILYLKYDTSPLLSIKAMLLYAYTVAMILLWRRVPPQARILFLITVVTHVLFITLSFMEMQPWALWSKRGGFLWIMTLLSMMVSAHALMPGLRKLMAAGMALGMLAFVINGWGNKDNLYPMLTNMADKNCYSHASALMAMDFNRYPEVFVTPYISTDIRFLYEYGILKGRDEEYNRFILMPGIPHNMNGDPKVEARIRSYETDLDAMCASLPAGTLIIGTIDTKQPGIAKRSKRLGIEPLNGSKLFFIKTGRHTTCNCH